MSEKEQATDLISEESAPQQLPIENSPTTSFEEEQNETPYSESEIESEIESLPPVQEIQEPPVQEIQELTVQEVHEEPETTPVPLPEEAPQQQSSEDETHIDFNFLETEGRWLLKVIGGPNTGAEFALYGGTAYVIGSEAKQCDIIFHDMSISRKHAKITIDTKENAIIEDLNSRNGTFIDGQKITSYPIKGNVMITLGTTTFILIDKTQEQKTIFAPKNVVTAIPQEISKDSAKASSKASAETMSQEGKTVTIEQMRQATIIPIQAEVEKIKETGHEEKQVLLTKAMGSLSILSIITILILVLGIGTALLFRTESITAPSVINPDEVITSTLAPFPAVRFSYNPSTQHLLLIGHVLTGEERSRMLDIVQQLPFLKDLSYDNVVIDEYVWREINQIIAKNPEWKGITITSPKAGQFVLGGFLKKRSDGESLIEYLNQNFPYMNLLEQKVVIEEDLLVQVERDLAQAGCQGVKAALSNGELILTGAITTDKKAALAGILTKLRTLPGIRGAQSQVVEAGQDTAFIDLTGRYRITGISKQGENFSVVINGRILSRGDSLDSMVITDITPASIFLERNRVAYKIDYIK